MVRVALTAHALAARMERFLQLRTKYLVETGQFVGTMKFKVAQALQPVINLVAKPRLLQLLQWPLQQKGLQVLQRPLRQ